MNRVTIQADIYEIRKIIGMHYHEINKLKDRIDEVTTTNLYGVKDVFGFVIRSQKEIARHEKRIEELNKLMQKLK